MLRGHFKSTLVCTASDEYVMGKENEKCGDAENKQKIGCWRIKYGKLWDTVKSLILTWNRGTRLWCTLMVVRCLWGRCPLLGGSEDGTSLWRGRRQKWPEAASAVAKNAILRSEDLFCFDFFFQTWNEMVQNWIAQDFLSCSWKCWHRWQRQARVWSCHSHQRQGRIWKGFGWMMPAGCLLMVWSLSVWLMHLI